MPDDTERDMTLSDHLVRFDDAMFVGDELQLGVGFDAARGGLANLARRGLLTSASAEAYGGGAHCRGPGRPLGFLAPVRPTW